MEILGLVDIPVWLLFISTLILTIVLYTWRKRSIFRRLGFKEKSSIFLLGDLLQMGKKGLSYYDLPVVRQHGKLFGTFFGNKPFLVISDAEMVKQITVKQFPNFQDRGIFDLTSKNKDFISAVSLAEGEHWRFLRSSLSPCFTTGKLRQMQTRVHGSLVNFLSNLQDKIKTNPEGLDCVPLFKGLTMDAICSTGFGMDVDSIRDPDNAFVRNANKVFEFTFGGNPVVMLNLFFPDLPGLSKLNVDFIPAPIVNFFKQATQSLLEERKMDDMDFPDLLHTMIHSHKQDTETCHEARLTQSKEDIKLEGLTEDEINTNSIVLMLAAYETTWVTLAWLTYDLAVHASCQETLIREIDTEHGEDAPSYDSVHKLKYLEMVVSETLRYHAPLQGMTRKALEDTDVCGVTIPKNMSILFPANALHFMSEYWEEPMEYKPERFASENRANVNEYAYFPFGQGPRNCIGMRLALLEIKMTLVSLLQRYRIVRTDKLQVPMTHNSAGSADKPASPVFVKLEPRK